MLRWLALIVFLSSCYPTQWTPDDSMAVGEWYNVTCLDDRNSFLQALEARAVINQEAARLGVLRTGIELQTPFAFCSLPEPFHCSYIPHKVVECAASPRSVFVSQEGYTEVYDHRFHIALGVINHMSRYTDLTWGCENIPTWPENEICFFENKKYEELIEAVSGRM